MLLELYQALSALTTSSLNFSSSALTSFTSSTANGVKKRKVGCVDIESNISRPLLQLTPLHLDTHSVWSVTVTPLKDIIACSFPSVPSDLFYSPGLALASTVHLEFIYNIRAIQVGVRNQFGYIKSGSSENTTMTMSKQPPIARPLPLHCPEPAGP